MNKQKEYVWIGTLTKPHGLKGEMKLLTDSEQFDERFSKGKTIYFFEKDQVKELVSNGYRLANRYLIISFEHFESIESVDKIKQIKVYAKKNNELFIDDLIGFKVIDSITKNNLGEVINYFFQKKYYSIEILYKGKKLNIPYLDQFIIKIDESKKEIYIDSSCLNLEDI